MTIHSQKKWVAVEKCNKSPPLKKRYKLRVLANLKLKKKKNIHLRMEIILQSVTKKTQNKTKRNMNLLRVKRKNKNSQRKEERKKMTNKDRPDQKLRKRNLIMTLRK